MDIGFSVHTQLAAHRMNWDPEVEGKVKVEFLHLVG